MTESDTSKSATSTGFFATAPDDAVEVAGGGRLGLGAGDDGGGEHVLDLGHGQRHRLVAVADEAGHGRGVPDRGPRLVGEVHADQDVAGENGALDHLALAVLDLRDLLGGDHDLVDVVLHVEGDDAVLEVRLHPVLHAGVGVHDEPVARLRPQLAAEDLERVVLVGPRRPRRRRPRRPGPRRPRPRRARALEPAASWSSRPRASSLSSSVTSASRRGSSSTSGPSFGSPYWSSRVGWASCSDTSCSITLGRCCGRSGWRPIRMDEPPVKISKTSLPKPRSSSETSVIMNDHEHHHHDEVGDQLVLGRVDDLAELGHHLAVERAGCWCACGLCRPAHRGLPCCPALPSPLLVCLGRPVGRLT